MSAHILRVVGNFREHGFREGAPSLESSRGKRGVSNKESVVRYLRGGTTYTFSPGFADDFFDPSRSCGQPSIITDGVYAWPKFLAYYVERYDVALPDDFEEHMKARSWTPPASVDINNVALPWEA